jgi:hypothetical protein
MLIDTNIHSKNDIIKEIKISKDYKPKSKSTDLLMKRYEIWRDLYSSNKRIAANLLQL